MTDVAQAKPLTALRQIADKASNSADRAYDARGRMKEEPTLHRAESKGMHEAKAATYSECHCIMQAELRRLMNRFQNGSLTMADFGVDP